MARVQSSALTALALLVTLAMATSVHGQPRPRFQIHERVTIREVTRPDAEACLVHLHGNEVNGREVMLEHAQTACVNVLWLDDALHKMPWGDDRIPVPSSTNETGKCTVNPNRVLTRGAFPYRIDFDCDNDPVAAAALRAWLDEQLLPALERCRGGDTKLPVVAYHNNSNLTVRDMDAREAVSVAGRESDILFVTHRADYERLKSLGRFSVALQSSPPANDGSLSVLLHDARYINVEAQIFPKNKPVNASMSEWAIKSVGAWRCGPGDWPEEPGPGP